MNVTVIEDQAAILKILLDNGVDGSVKPQNPNARGAVAMFNDRNTDGLWYIVDKQDNLYTAVKLEGLSPAEAGMAMDLYIKEVMDGQVSNGRLNIIDAPAENRN